MLLLLAQHLHYEVFAEMFGEAEHENHVVLRLLHRTVRGAEEGVVAAAAVHGVGAEAGGAVVLGHQAPSLAGAVAVSHKVGVLLEHARIDVDTAILIVNRLSFDTDVADENFLFFHC